MKNHWFKILSVIFHLWKMEWWPTVHRSVGSSSTKPDPSLCAQWDIFNNLHSEKCINGKNRTNWWKKPIWNLHNFEIFVMNYQLVYIALVGLILGAFFGSFKKVKRVKKWFKRGQKWLKKVRPLMNGLKISHCEMVKRSLYVVSKCISMYS